MKAKTEGKEGRMNILVYGAGVIGSVYAARLQEAGYNVSLLARGQRAVSLRTQGILLEDTSTGHRTTTRVSIVDHLAPTDSYDVVIVTVRLDQLTSILPVLAANHQIPTLLFMLNNPDGMQRLEMLEPHRVLLGFPSIGGSRTRRGHPICPPRPCTDDAGERRWPGTTTSSTPRNSIQEGRLLCCTEFRYAELAQSARRHRCMYVGGCRHDTGKRCEAWTDT